MRSRARFGWKRQQPVKGSTGCWQQRRRCNLTRSSKLGHTVPRWCSHRRLPNLVIFKRSVIVVFFFIVIGASMFFFIVFGFVVVVVVVVVVFLVIVSAALIFFVIVFFFLAFFLCSEAATPVTLRGSVAFRTCAKARAL